jgi:hypothetical protein
LRVKVVEYGGELVAIGKQGFEDPALSGLGRVQLGQL